LRYLLLGALLPDATRFTIILVDVLDWPAIPTFTYLIPFHSLLMAALLAGVIALLVPSGNSGSWRAFGLIMAGATFHFLLDDLEGPIGCGSTTFYPLYFGKPINAWNSQGYAGTLLLVISAITLGVAIGRRQQLPLLTFRFTRWRILGAAGLLAAILVIPFIFQTWMVKQNAYFLGFVTNPAAFAGQSVELCFSKVVHANPLTIEEFDTSFVVRTSSMHKVGEWVSVRGIYEDSVIWPATLIRHQGFADVMLSLVAAVTFVILMFDSRYLKVFLPLG
jgi:thiosulfate reductase cytochrome b subunit